ncbi:MAG: Fur family transcriptional regulator [Rhodospirillales bacterium]|nr:Fur family transcriptional regulator [Rhodospirillales bacterium]
MKTGTNVLPGNTRQLASDQGLTETRRRVFELVIKAGQPVGAYRLLEAMQDKGTRVMPPTVYRALNFLQGKGLVHRIESLNAFVACTHADHAHDGQFLICSDCGRSEELEDERVSALLREQAETHGFTLTQQTIELKGRCKDCAGK